MFPIRPESIATRRRLHPPPAVVRAHALCVAPFGLQSIRSSSHHSAGRRDAGRRVIRPNAHRCPAATHGVGGSTYHGPHNGYGPGDGCPERPGCLDAGGLSLDDTRAIGSQGVRRNHPAHQRCAGRDRTLRLRYSQGRGGPAGHRDSAGTRGCRRTAVGARCRRARWWVPGHHTPARAVSS